MKIVYSLFIIFFFVTPFTKTFAQNYWRKIESPTFQDLYKVQFIDGFNGWAAGDSGIILHTTNGGNSWGRQNSKLNTLISDLVFLNQNLGWGLSLKYTALPYGTYILKTTNGGLEWDTTLISGDNTFFNKIYWVDTSVGFLGGFGGTLLKTTNGGMNWYQTYVDTGVVSHLPILNFAFYNHQYGFACGGFIDFSGVVWKTTDYGESWYETSVSADPIHSLHFLDSMNVIGIGGDFEYGTGSVRSTDAGLTWTYTSLQVFGVGFKLAFRTPTEAWIPIGIGNDIPFTLNAGQSWSTYRILNHNGKVFDYSLRDIDFPDSLTGYAVGDDGVILKYNLSPQDFITYNRNTAPETFSVSQNYPNPFNPSTKIDYSLSAASHVKLIVYDILGKQVKTLVNEFKQPGSYRVTFTSGNLPSGIYFYEFKTEKFSSVKKMIIIK